MWRGKGNVQQGEAKDTLMCTTEMFCSIRAQFWEQVGVVWVPGMSLEPSRGVMILIQQNICDGRCSCENPKDMAAFTFLSTSRASLLWPTPVSKSRNSQWTGRVTTVTVIINSKLKSFLKWILDKSWALGLNGDKGVRAVSGERDFKWSDRERVMEHLRDSQKHKINIYIEYTANLQTHLLDLIFLVSAFVHSFDSLCLLAETHHAVIWTKRAHTHVPVHAHTFFFTFLPAVCVYWKLF